MNYRLNELACLLSYGINMLLALLEREICLGLFVFDCSSAQNVYDLGEMILAGFFVTVLSQNTQK